MIKITDHNLDDYSKQVYLYYYVDLPFIQGGHECCRSFQQANGLFTFAQSQ